MNPHTSIQEGTLKITCPYCGAELVRDYDLFEIEEDLIDSLPDPDWCFDCPHVAAFRVWGYVDTEVRSSWAEELGQLTALVAANGDNEGLEPEFDDLLDYLEDQSQKDQARVTLPGVDLTFVHHYLEKMAGVHGGGSNFHDLVDEPSRAGDRGVITFRLVRASCL